MRASGFRRAVVTGGASGIGRAVVERLRADGHTVLSVDIDPSGGEVAAACGAMFMQADVSDPGRWSAVVERVGQELDGLDLLVLNAGVLTGTPDILELTDQAIDRALGVNIGGVLHGLRAGAPLLKDGGGDVVVTASLAGLMAYTDDPVYALTKHAVVGLARSVAPRLHRSGVRVHVLCPGVIDTPMVPDRVRSAVAAIGVPVLAPSAVAEHLVELLDVGGTGRIWLSQALLGLTEHTPTSVPLPQSSDS